MNHPRLKQDSDNRFLTCTAHWYSGVLSVGKFAKKIEQYSEVQQNWMHLPPTLSLQETFNQTGNHGFKSMFGGVLLFEI